jgi:hypothetical protein
MGIAPAHARAAALPAKPVPAAPQTSAATSSSSSSANAPASAATLQIGWPLPTGVPDRATLARLVEHVLAAHGIARGSGIPAAAAAVSAPHRHDESPAAKSAGAATPQSPTAAPKPFAAAPAPKPAKPSVEISPFVSENDVRQAMTRSQKIFIGPKTIVTPSARDLGREHEVFVDTGAESGAAS